MREIVTTLTFVLVLLGCTPVETAPQPVSPPVVVPEPPVVPVEDFEDTEAAWQDASLPLQEIELPPGFSISLFAGNIDNARSMTYSDSGVLYVGTRRAGKVYALEDRDSNFKVDRVTVIAQGLNSPNGVAWKDGDLYVAEINRVLKFPQIDKNLREKAAYEIVSEAYPSDQSHGWKFIRFSPTGKLHVPVGAPCNICDPKDSIYSTITELDLDTGEPTVVAQGIRNTVGFDWHPETGQLWFTDNGRDRLGDNKPVDELNQLTETGQHFGFPYCHQGDLLDPEFGVGQRCADYVPPVQKLGPHVAALGMRFYTGSQFPDQYKNQVFIAEHGSWNRTEPIGYRVTLVNLDEAGQTLGYTPFAHGWLSDSGVSWGRPVDVEILPDGSMLVSDDAADAIYRISHLGE